jgi:hypothetical protein
MRRRGSIRIPLNPPHRRSPSGALYGYHAAWFAEAASRVSDRVTPRFEALSANLARCSS